MPRGKNKRKRVSTGKYLPPRKSLNTSITQLENSRGDFQDEAWENLLAAAIRDPRGGEAWLMLRLNTAKLMAKVPGQGARWV